MEPRGGRFIGCTEKRGSRGFLGSVVVPLSGGFVLAPVASLEDQSGLSFVFGCGEDVRSAFLLGGCCAGLSALIV